MPCRGFAIAAAALVACLTVWGIIADFLVDWVWFTAIGYWEVFWTIFRTRTSLFLAVLVTTASFVFVNGWLASRLPDQVAPGRFLELTTASVRLAAPDLQELARRHLSLLVLGAAAALGTLLAVVEMANWDVLLRFLFQVPYGQSDPVFGKDIGFYLFSLPAYVALKNWMLLTIILAARCAGVYWVRGDIAFGGQASRCRAAIAHASALLGPLSRESMVVLPGPLSSSLWRQRGRGGRKLHRSHHGVAGPVGVDRALRHRRCRLVGEPQARTYRLPLQPRACVRELVRAGRGLPALFQRLFVKPNELELERPYLQHNIALTQAAYNLHQITAKPFPAEQNLTLASLQANQATIDNIRLWDGPPLMDAYRQLQEIRTYYKFHDVDVDRYWLNGAYQQLMLVSPGAQLGAPPAECPNLGQPPCAVHARLRRDHEPGHPQEQRRPADLLSRGYSAGRDRGAPVLEPRIYYGELTDTIRVRQGKHPGVRLPERQGERLCGL